MEALFTPSQVARLLPNVNGRPVHRTTVWRWIKAGLLPTTRFGGRNLVSLDAVLAFLARTQQGEGGSETVTATDRAAIEAAAAREHLRKEYGYPL